MNVTPVDDARQSCVFMLAVMSTLNDNVTRVEISMYKTLSAWLGADRQQPIEQLFPASRTFNQTQFRCLQELLSRLFCPLFDLQSTQIVRRGSEP